MAQGSRRGGDCGPASAERAGEKHDPSLAMVALRRNDRDGHRRVVAALARFDGEAKLAAAELTDTLGKMLQGRPATAVWRGALEQRFREREPIAEPLAEEVCERPAQADRDGREAPAAPVESLAEGIGPAGLASRPDILAEELDDSRLRGGNDRRGLSGTRGIASAAVRVARIVTCPDADVD